MLVQTILLGIQLLVLTIPGSQPFQERFKSLMMSEHSQQVEESKHQNSQESYKIMKYQTYVYPTSDEKDPVYELKAGKIIKILGEKNEWYQIEFFRYAEPVEGKKWIKKNAVVNYDPRLAKEGYLKAGAVIFDEEGVFKEEGNQNTIFILSERGEFFEIEAPGGIWGFINKSDFVPNPFGKFIHQ
ncbi:hypothetical protein ACQCN2_17045 [Brevibacillus ginsengisoli]|uniref:hypothetical protein n=1 Tax=Brevibacillus ginsengisoli TaxID=363854 RepID=UPI003CEBDA45